MAYRKTPGRLLKAGQNKIDKLLNSPYVIPYHKTLLKGLKSRAKNLSQSDGEILKLLINTYKNI